MTFNTLKIVGKNGNAQNWRFNPKPTIGLPVW